MSIKIASSSGPYNAAAREAWAQLGIQVSSPESRALWDKLRETIFSKFPHLLKDSFLRMTEDQATPIVKRFLEHEGAQFFNHTDIRFINAVQYFRGWNDNELKTQYSGLYYLVRRAIYIVVGEMTRPRDRRSKPTDSEPNPGAGTSHSVYPAPTDYADYDYDSCKVHFGVLSEDLMTFFEWKNDKYLKLDRSFVEGLFRFVEMCYAMEIMSLATLKISVFVAGGDRPGERPPWNVIFRSDSTSQYTIQRIALMAFDKWKNSEGVLQIATIPCRRELVVTNVGGSVATRKRTHDEMTQNEQ